MGVRIIIYWEHLPDVGVVVQETFVGVTHVLLDHISWGGVLCTGLAYVHFDIVRGRGDGGEVVVVVVVVMVICVICYWVSRICVVA